jgi:ELWxxDGT repeat protein
VFFAADNGGSGMELWKSDGTAAGTRLVKDIWAGSDGSYPFDLLNVGGTLFFSSDDGIAGTELWKSDGTAAGTQLVKDILAGPGGSYPGSLQYVDGLLFFSADNGVKGSELWKSDGSVAGTVLVKDVWPGSASGTVGNFSKVVNKLIFTGNDGVNGYKTWESDGSPSGTTIVTGIGDPGDGDMQELVETDNSIYASIRQTSLGRELWAISYTSVLPLQLLEFRGKLDKTDAILNWKTTNEINTEEFVIERSADGTHFTPIGNVHSINTPGNHSYSFIDPNIVDAGNDIFYYRLKQRDADSRYTYSKVVTISVTGKTGVDLYPNPAANNLRIAIDGSRKEKLDIRIYDNTGRLVKQETSQLVSGTNNLSVNVNNLASGNYYLKLSSSSIDKRLQFIKQ